MNFRIWCQQKWYEHIDELHAYGQSVSYSSKEYFSQYKYWLKREFKYQRNVQ
jgi:hypothetical protein